MRQVYLFWVVSVWAFGDEGLTFEFSMPEVKVSFFGEEVGMVDRERDDYATALAVYAANRVAEKGASADSLLFARRALGLALHLSLRNRKAVVARAQLGRGVLPKKEEPRYSDRALAALFVARAEALFEQKGEKNQFLGRALIDLAVTIDPHNEDAVYAYELQRIDYGAVPWEKLEIGK